MQEWINQYFLYVFPLYFAALWVGIAYWIALIGGWRLLAKRFRMQGTFSGQKWNMQSARMRALSHYNNALTVGANDSGLFIVPFIMFRAWHPALFVPWTEISVIQATQLFFFKFVELRLGRSEQVPFRIRPTLAVKIEAAAGPGWPVGYHRATEFEPPPIGEVEVRWSFMNSAFRLQPRMGFARYCKNGNDSATARC
jgi:hypothetical protein